MKIDHVSSNDGIEKRQLRLFSLFLLLTYLVLPSTALKIFSAFKTDEFDAGSEGERSFLAVGTFISI